RIRITISTLTPTAAVRRPRHPRNRGTAEHTLTELAHQSSVTTSPLRESRPSWRYAAPQPTSTRHAPGAKHHPDARRLPRLPRPKHQDGLPESALPAPDESSAS